MNKVIVGVALLAILGTVGATNARSDRPKTATPKVAVSHREHCKSARMAVPHYRGETHLYQAKRGLDDLADVTPVVRGKSCHWARYAADEWVARHAVARKKYLAWFAEQRRIERERARQARALYAKWECIHQHEGAWDSNTGNGYYGGLQMDIGFQSAYGPEFMDQWGTADKWPVWAQLTAAERAYASRGFGPWPNTARMCGVL